MPRERRSSRQTPPLLGRRAGFSGTARGGGRWWSRQPSKARTRGPGRARGERRGRTSRRCTRWTCLTLSWAPTSETRPAFKRRLTTSSGMLPAAAAAAKMLMMVVEVRVATTVVVLESGRGRVTERLRVNAGATCASRSGTGRLSGSSGRKRKPSTFCGWTASTARRLTSFGRWCATTAASPCCTPPSTTTKTGTSSKSSNSDRRPPTSATLSS
mmetsp:Transcript_39976/g.73753  ORF Transcript_39976/g.73753 Transcript_39976/m.73753 type:complete len:214 (+) Transcript_39976:234-875(+)